MNGVAPDANSSLPLDSLTVAAIAILTSLLGSLLHEAAGHGGACLLVGARPLVLSSVHFECSADSRLVDAGGTLMNLLVAALFLAVGRFVPRAYPRWKFFFWLAMTTNLYAGTGYFLFSGVGGFGDWADFIQGLGPRWLWRTGLALFGAITYYLSARLSLLELRPLIGSDKQQRYRRAVRLTAIPYFSSGILMCIAGAFNPRGAILILISAAASTFGGTCGLLWATPFLKSGTMVPYGPPAEALPIRRSWLLMVASVAAAVVFIAVVAPGIRFSR